MPMPTPVEMPWRRRQSAATGAKRDTIPIAVRQARAGASRCANGTLKPTSRLSPAMLKIVPSSAYAASVSTAKYSFSMSTTVSTPMVSVMRVKPRRSANSATTSARSACVRNGPPLVESMRMRSVRRGET